MGRLAEPRTRTWTDLQTGGQQVISETMYNLMQDIIKKSNEIISLQQSLADEKVKQRKDKLDLSYGMKQYYNKEKLSVTPRE